MYSGWWNRLYISTTRRVQMVKSLLVLFLIRTRPIILFWSRLADVLKTGSSKTSSTVWEFIIMTIGKNTIIPSFANRNLRESKANDLKVWPCVHFRVVLGILLVFVYCSSAIVFQVCDQYIPKIFNFTQEKRVNRDIFGQKSRMVDVLLIYFEQIQSFCALTPVFLKLYPEFCKFRK